MSRYWLVVGSPENWKTAFEHNNIWGLKESQRRLWDSLQEGDRLLFYATSPVVGLIGHGTVSTKFRQNHPLWPQELKEAKVIWPLRFEFDVGYCLPPGGWKERRIVSKDLWPRGGFQPLGEQLGEQLISSFEEADPTIPLSEPSGLADALTELKPISADPEEVLLSHDDLKEALVQIGRLQKFIAESEYQFDIGRLDVVWRRVEKSVPTYVFEIQIGGNLHQAMSKLKHAYDVWNSHVYLVTPEEDFEKANQLLSGTFHEIQGRLRLIDCPQVRELLEKKKGYMLLEKELGIT